jgi:diguanylate cyclase (GGDEF)-like protein
MHGLEFLTAQHDLSTAFIAKYDYTLVIVSYLIACLSAYIAWNMAELYRYESNLQKKLMWVTGGGLVMGCGIWAMHFVAMLAYKLPVAINYDINMTILSMLPAVVASIIAIAIIGQLKQTAGHLVIGSIFFGAGIGAMHYTGMSAMRLNAMMMYEPFYFGLSIVVAVGLAFISLKLKAVTDSYSNHVYYSQFKLVSILMMGAAVAGMHYTGMVSVYYFPISMIDPSLSTSHDEILATMVSILALLILLSTIVITLFEKRIKNVRLSADTSRERMFEAIDNISDGFVLFDSNDRLILHNEQYKKMYQEIGEWIKPGVSYRELLEKRAEFADLHIKGNALKYIDDRLLWHKNPNDHFVETLKDGRHVFGKEKRSESGDLVGIWTDISELKRAEDQLLHGNRQLQMVLDVSPSPTVIRSFEDSELVYLNQSATEFFANNNIDVQIGSKDNFLDTSDYEDIKKIIFEKGTLTNAEFEISSIIGRKLNLMMSATSIVYDNKVAILLSFMDITTQKNLENQLRELAQTDHLTGIHNRRYFAEAGAKEISRCMRNKLPLTLIMLDIDLFKHINDKFGHDVGDQVIVHTAQVCRDSIRDTDILGRMGGEEFAIILPDKGIEDAKIIAERIRKIIEETSMKNDKLDFNFTASIGISTLKAGEQDSLQKMLIRADEKMYLAKNNGRNQVVF